MITADELRKTSLHQITVIAKEFIINTVEPSIRAAASKGRFFDTVSFEGVPERTATAKEVVRILETQGFSAEHVYYDGPNGYDNYILVKWEED